MGSLQLQLYAELGYLSRGRIQALTDLAAAPWVQNSQVNTINSLIASVARCHLHEEVWICCRPKPSPVVQHLPDEFTSGRHCCCAVHQPIGAVAYRGGAGGGAAAPGAGGRGAPKWASKHRGPGTIFSIGLLEPAGTIASAMKCTYPRKIHACIACNH
jgi:hypothetical protein